MYKFIFCENILKTVAQHASLYKKAVMYTWYHLGRNVTRIKFWYLLAMLFSSPKLDMAKNILHCT